MTNLNNIPLELRKLNQWLIWKADKKPRNPRNSTLASVSDPSIWTSYNDACKGAKDYKAGLGFVFTENDPYCAIDLDKVIDDDGVIAPWAQEIIDKLDSYTEVSQSGHGIHIIVRGKKPGEESKKDGVEIYDQGRYFALTGNLWQDRAAINDRQAELDWLYERTFGEKKQKTEPITAPIREGEGRNIACTREAGRLLSIYKDPAVVKPMVWAYNQAICKPPLDEKECSSTWEKSLTKWAEKTQPEKKTAPVTPQIISASDLVNKEFPPLIFAIPGIVPEGLTLLAGKPKAGKSWLALQAAYSVALGKNLMDGSAIERGGALVLGLEDGERRLKARLGKVNSADCVLKVMAKEGGGVHIVGNLGGVPAGMDLTTTWPRIGSGGIEELEKYLDEHPNVRLVVIDTIKRFTMKKGKGTAYDEDYDSVQPLQELAMRRRIPILAVCHIRKALSDDPLDMVSGTFGLTGGVDNILVLQREGGDEFRLSIIGRDIESRELAVVFGENCMWTLLGDADIYFVSEAREKILGCLVDFGAMKPKEIAEGTKENPNTVRNLLAKMLRDGQVKKDASGKYSTAKGKVA
jgi:hypothetical protein